MFNVHVCETTMYHVFKRIIGVDLLLDITASNQKGFFFCMYFFPILSYLAQYELCLLYICLFIAKILLLVPFRLHGWAYITHVMCVSAANKKKRRVYSVKYTAGLGDN